MKHGSPQNIVFTTDFSMVTCFCSCSPHVWAWIFSSEFFPSSIPLFLSSPLKTSGFDSHTYYQILWHTHPHCCWHLQRPGLFPLFPLIAQDLTLILILPLLSFSDGAFYPDTSVLWTSFLQILVFISVKTFLLLPMNAASPWSEFLVFYNLITTSCL